MKTNVTEELRQQLRSLLEPSGSSFTVEHEGGPVVAGVQMRGVWVVDARGALDDLIGAGESEAEALSDAIETVRGWVRS